MNALIKELIEQATVRTDDPNERVQRLELNPELLVQLVVRRCAEIANDADIYQTYNQQVEICEEFGLTD